MTTRERQERLDVVLVERGLAPSRTQAQALILAGRVSSLGIRLEKPGHRIAAEAPIEVEPGPRFVSRGGLKLSAALAAFGVRAAGLDTLDVGSSTGGFTQVLLEAGASRVAALDVGRGQLDWGLRNDPRVAILEGINARHLDPSALPFRPALAVMDVSFISLERVLPPVAACLAQGGEIVALVKPQFEVGRGKVGRGGIVREPALHAEVLARLAAFAREREWGVLGAIPSPIRGAEGNVEFFLHLAPGRPGLEGESLAAAIEEAVRRGGETGA
jgi:23S rRNA (cytidine1920-2'-O)/16S rRNA (cytidine1409-2'-O)-methyltransferase